MYWSVVFERIYLETEQANWLPIQFMDKRESLY